MEMRLIRGGTVRAPRAVVLGAMYKDTIYDKENEIPQVPWRAAQTGRARDDGPAEAQHYF